MEGNSDGTNPLDYGTPGNDDNIPPMRGIGLRVTNIEGNPMMPRRGMFSTNNASVIDGLFEISKPVELDATWGYGGNYTAAKKDNHANPSSSNVENKGSAINVEGFCDPTRQDSKSSYADKLQSKNRIKREVNFRLLEPEETREDADVVIPKEVVQQVQDKFDNVLYGYFLGNRLPFPVVEYYANNVWAKFGFSKLMMNTSGFFFFKFDSKDGLMKVLEGGPWLIRKIPLFLNIWTPKVTLKKDSIKTVPIWVKLHNVPISVYTDDGFSLLASKLGVPKRLDSYTADMCVDNWGRSSYARAMIEINADNELKDHITLAIPKMDEEGFIMERVDVEYEWKPLRCPTCCLFGHDHATCSKVMKEKAKQVVVDEDGFITDRKRVAKHSFPQKKQKPKFIYKPKANKSGASTSGTKKDEQASSSGPSIVKVANSFQVLDTVGDGEGSKEDNVPVEQERGSEKVTRLSDVVQESIPTEMSKFMTSNLTSSHAEGASTPGYTETHVNVGNLVKVCKGVFRSWNWTSNGALCQRGTRIILGWNEDDVDLMVLSQSDQVIHTQVRLKAESKTFLCSFVYAENKYQDRRILWEDLCKLNIFARDQPWVILGDFNTALNMEDSLYGPSNHTIGMREFFDCIQHVELMDVQSHGLHFTWNQKPKEGIGVLKKIDRIMSNVKFMDLFPDTYALFKPARVSDHTPCVLKLASIARKKLKPFKFSNFLTTKEEFRRYVTTEWAKGIQGFAMFSVVKKMRNLKPRFRKLLYQQGNLHEKVCQLRKELDDIQQLVDANPMDGTIRDTAAKCLRDYQVAAYDEECFLKQKSKVEWLCAGDSNTSFFHKCVKSRNARNKISCINDIHGNRFEGDGITGALVDHYSNFLGTAQLVSRFDDDDLFRNTLSQHTADQMVRQVTREEVKQAMFGIGENKAPGPDGFTSAFFKHAWDIVGDEVTNAVLDFFENGKLLKQVNHTILALVPKMDTPNSVLDYRPISCCNVLYKCTSKIITDRIKGSLDKLVSINQSAFVPGRKISDNILLTQELMHNYHLNRGKRGLRQGDPMSPYLFTLVMEVLTLILQRTASNTSFKFHGQYSKQKIINILFADDLFLFSHGDSVSVKHLQVALDKFTQISGLVPSMPKSTVFFSNVTSAMKNQILNLLPFQEGSLPVRYLGVPLISTRLSARDCKILLERIQRRIDNWITKSLSFAGRLQLINLVLAAMYSYWASVFMLPVGIIKDLEKRAGFSLSSTVADLVTEDGQWRWPQAWYDTFPVLINIDTIQLTPDTDDRFHWKDWEGNFQCFRSWEAWNNLRYRETKVVWVNSVWFSQCIPRHSFHLWLVIKNKLRTQDRMAEWEAGSATNLHLMCCPLCRYDRDSRDHLFFQCPYASEVWSLVRNKVDMGSVNDTWASIMQWMEVNANSRTLEHIVCNILVAASTYFIWQERNNRIFSQLQRNASVLSKVIVDTVRLRIMGFRIGRDPKHRKLLDRWLISKEHMDMDPD
ncbi:uncharacterized protein LOC110944741 [Helianthus annuus]|uniref:uncharacterized protein LOC110944741 n=1 Tax=Helianthus annuus TaxID=4232 RepID=UPI000B8F43A4|nr:uncharacterized protein LOC110944741 [Helianthus annuus]